MIFSPKFYAMHEKISYNKARAFSKKANYFLDQTVCKTCSQGLLDHTSTYINFFLEVYKYFNCQNKFKSVFSNLDNLEIIFEYRRQSQIFQTSKNVQFYA